MNAFSNWDEVPLFDSDAAEAGFWAENRPDLRLMESAVAGGGESAESVTISLRIDPRMLARIKRLARSRYLNYQSMIKQWLSERMEHEVAGANPGHSAKNPSISRPARTGAFTLIELLVVIAIIGILAGLILGLGGIASAKMRRSKAEGEREALATAIQSYKNDLGFYPPDNTNNSASTYFKDNTITVPLFYELTGTFTTVASNVTTYNSPVNRDTLTSSQVQSIFGPGTMGFMNSTPNSNEVHNFFLGASKAARTGIFLIPTTTNAFTMFGISVKGPAELITTTNSDHKFFAINPWHYVSTNPTNNTGAFDLWIDVLYSGNTNRISNWSPVPQVVH